jgi:uncharacterized protein YjbI with pentapeptide repeats
MTIEPNSSPSQGLEHIPETLNGATHKPTLEPSEAETPTQAIQLSPVDSWEIETENSTLNDRPNQVSGSVVVLSAMALMILGLGIDNIVLGYASAFATLALSLRLVWSNWGKVWETLIPPSWRNLIIACVGILGSLIGLVIFSNANTPNEVSNITINWDAIGALGDLGGALGQILIAIIAVYVAWRQYIISRDLTIQQNRITQQQTIDAYFQGVSDLALGEQGLLEDWPQERVIAEGRTSAIIKSVDAEGKAKILRFLSQARLITPLQRDRHLGRPMLDGNGNYAEDRAHGVRVIDLGAMLAGADLSETDLRRTDLTDTNLVKANLTGCNLVRANLARSILYEADLSRTNLRSIKLFYGPVETASPRSRTLIPNFETGEYTGAVVENADFTGVDNLSEENRYYCCAWCGSKSRKTIPGGCEGIPNKLDR